LAMAILVQAFSGQAFFWARPFEPLAFN